MFNFIPQEDEVPKVPFYEDANKADGWQGQATTKSVKKLQDEITKSISRIGGIVSGFKRGIFNIEEQNRDGFQVFYSLKSPSGQYVPGRLDIASLPVRDRWNDTKKEKSVCMALYMLREALDGMWLIQQLSPGYAALMPWMITDNGKTVSQLWSESPVMSNLLPAGSSEFIEAEIV